MKLSRVSQKLLFEGSFFLTGHPGVIKHLREFLGTQWQPYNWLLARQMEGLQHLLQFSYEHIPYYQKLLDAHHIKLSDIKNLRDMQRIPILNKRIIRQNRDEIVPDNLTTMRYVRGSTGGSTGESLQYMMSADDHALGLALLRRGWGYGEYRPGDKIVTIAGSSLIPSSSFSLSSWIVKVARNQRSLSSYGMSDEKLGQYVQELDNFRPEFLRGYATSLFTLASFIRSEKLAIPYKLRAVFSTSEKLLDTQRQVIEEVFDTKVFDNYGLNDGGISAYECKEHSGMHIDMERAILEVVDENGDQIYGRPGRILATSLYNYAFPFIRYDTGDIGVMEYSECSCGRQLPLLRYLLGRTTDVLELNGQRIGSPVLTVLFGKFDIEQYQIIQESPVFLTCRIVRGETYSEENEHFIRQSITEHVGQVNIAFEYISSMDSSDGSKHKFIVKRDRVSC